MSEDKILEKLTKHDEQFDFLASKLLEHDEILEFKADKNDVQQIMNTLDGMATILKRLDQERIFTANGSDELNMMLKQ